MNKKIVSAAILVVLSAFLIVPSGKAQTASAWTDKIAYNPGDSGKLLLSILNEGSEAFTIRNITIVYNDWFAYVKDHWEGNETIVLSPTVAVGSKGGSYYRDDITFTVPTDGRATSTSVNIRVGIVEGGIYLPTVHSSIQVATPSGYGGIYEMDKMVMLLTLQPIILIVCTIIIAAAIFIGTRRRRMEMKTE